MHNARLAVRNERLALQAVASHIYALDLKDDYTAQHSAAVAQWATDIAKAMRLTEQQVNLTHLAGLLHDVGKIGVPDELLKSPDKLERRELGRVESHCFHGHKILGQIDQFEELAKVVLHHHERYDGNGYPHGLVGRAHPPGEPHHLRGRLLLGHDQPAALSGRRCPTVIAEAELEFRKGTQFDPEVVDCFLDLLARSDEAYRLGKKADFRMEVQAVKFLRDLPAEGTRTSCGQEPPEPASPAGVGASAAAADRSGGGHGEARPTVGAAATATGPARAAPLAGAATTARTGGDTGGAEPAGEPAEGTECRRAGGWDRRRGTPSRVAGRDRGRSGTRVTRRGTRAALTPARLTGRRLTRVAGTRRRPGRSPR